MQLQTIRHNICSASQHKLHWFLSCLVSASLGSSVREFSYPLKKRENPRKTSGMERWWEGMGKAWQIFFSFPLSCLRVQVLRLVMSVYVTNNGYQMPHWDSRVRRHICSLFSFSYRKNAWSTFASVVKLYLTSGKTLAYACCLQGRWLYSWFFS